MEISNSKTGPSLLLFTLLDRFSRNTAEAYLTIKTLQSMGVTTCAVEQPLDLSVPENKMMLAIYLATPEIENDRRGLNVKNGIRKAKECGKWVGPAPTGYMNYTYPDGGKAIVQKEPEASIVRQAFMKLTAGTHTISAVYREAVNQGLRCSRSNFCNLIKNPVYAGKMKWRGEENRILVTHGRHIGIVSDDVFNKVQELFKREAGTYCIGYSPDFPFRGFMQCPRCGKILTGSVSSGRSKKYVYYHCRQNCRYRIRAEVVFECFLNRLAKLEIISLYSESYHEILNELLANRYRNLSGQKLRALKSIDQFVEQMSKSKDLMLKSDISFEVYCEIKNDCEVKIKTLGEVVNSCTQVEYDLIAKSSGMTKRISRLSEFFCDLDDKHRSSFLNCFLLRPANWEEKDHQSIFKLSVNLLFRNSGCLIANGDDKTTASTDGLLHQLAQLQLSFEHQNVLI